MVYKFFGNQIMEGFGLGAVGIKLCPEAGITDCSQEGRQAPVYGGFPTCDADAVNPVLLGLQLFEYRVKRNGFQGVRL